MNCRQARDLLPLYADGELDGAKRAGVAEHLRQCPRCRERLELDIRLAAELAAYGPEAAGHVDLRSKVMAQVDRERRRQPIRRMALRLGNVAVGLVVSAVAVALLVGIALTVRPLAERARRCRDGSSPATWRPGRR
jgi:anti-sigma factor RsiW